MHKGRSSDLFNYNAFPAIKPVAKIVAIATAYNKQSYELTATGIVPDLHRIPFSFLPTHDGGSKTFIDCKDTANREQNKTNLFVFYAAAKVIFTI